MRKRPIIIITLFSLITLLVAINFSFLEKQKVSAQSGYSESFETDWGGWVPDHYLYCEHQNPPCPLQEWTIDRSTKQAYDGSYSLEGYLDAMPYDDGTIWVERPFTAQPDSNIKVDINFYLWSGGYSDVNRWPVVAYSGLKNPEVELDFAEIGETNEVVGWKNYPYSANFKTDSNGIFWIGFGFSATWETARTYYMDFINVNIASSDPSTAISKSVDKISAPPGDILTYTITYTNDTGQTVTNIKIQDWVPPGTTFVSASSGYRFLNSVVYWNLVNLSPGQKWQVSFQVRIQ